MMPPGSSEVIHQAAASGWITGLLAVLVIGGYVTLGAVMRRQGADLRDLQQFVRGELVNLILQCNVVQTELKDAIKAAPCGADWDSDKLRENIERVQQRQQQRDSEATDD